MSVPCKIPALPLSFDVESKAVMKKTALARGALAEMKGVASGMPNAIAANMRQIIYGGILIFMMFRYSRGFEVSQGKLKMS